MARCSHGRAVARVQHSGQSLVMLPDKLKKDLREVQDLYQRRIMTDDLDELGDAKVGIIRSAAMSWRAHLARTRRIRGL